MADKIQTPTIIAPPSRWPRLDLSELWALRAICSVFARRSLKVRYKQTVIGAGWAVLQPFMLMIVFSVFFGFLVRVPSGDAPYPVFVFTGLVVWQVIGRVFNEASMSVTGNAHLISRIYFPRVYLPLAVILGGLVDLFFGLLALAALLAWYGIVPGWPVLTAPLFLLLALAGLLGVVLWTAPLNAFYRDVGHLLPFLTQLWMFTSPIIYPATLVPAEWRLLYAVNPLATAVEGFRWSLLGGAPPLWETIAVSTGVATALIVSGFVYFRKAEKMLPDVV